MPTGMTGPARPRGFAVLVVEDEFLIAMYLEVLLERHGWHVLGPAASVAEALRLLDDGSAPDVALLDVNLRGELVAPLAEALENRGVPFVLASAYDRPDQMAEALAGAANVGKPFDEERLLAALAHAVER